MKRINKILSLSIFLILLLTLTGCSNSRPEKVTKEYIEAIKKMDYKKIEKLTSPKLEESREGEDLSQEDELMDYLKANAKKIEYEILDLVEDEDKAKVDLKFKYIDSSKLIQNIFIEILAESMTTASSDEELTDEKMDKLKKEIISKNIEGFEEEYIEEEVSLNLIKVEDKWYIEKHGVEFENIMTSNMYSMLKDILNSFGTTSPKDD